MRIVPLVNLPASGQPIGVAVPFTDIPQKGQPIGVAKLVDPDAKKPKTGQLSVSGDIGSAENVSSIQFTYADDQLLGKIAVSGQDGVAVVRTPVIRITEECPCGGGGGGGGGDLDGGTP